MTLHVVRPYASEAELIEREGWTVQSKGMLLVDQDALPADTVVRFDVALADGTKLVVAEGKVVGAQAADGDRPGGLRVRFRRFGASTKAFIDRVVERRSAATSERSGVHAKPAATPPDRDALLARLRERARGLVKVVEAEHNADETG